MARKKFSYVVTKNIAAVPKTILQLNPQNTGRVVITKIEVIPEGATSATAAILFDIVKQSSAGTSSTVPTANKREPACSEAIATTAASDFTAEPSLTANSIQGQFSAHQQSYVPWIPEGGELVLPGYNGASGQLYGIRCVSSSAPNINVTLVVHCEE